MPEPEHILVLENDRDIAELLAEMLAQEGYTVTTAADAAAAIATLRARDVALVLATMRAPGRSVAALRAAEADGLLERTAALVVTADAPELAGTPWRALREPVDFDLLIDEVHRMVVARAAARVTASTREEAAAMPVLELVLYVTASSPSSRRAQRNLERVLAEHAADAVSLRVIDLGEAPDAADPEDKVAFTPTLVRRSPRPRVWLLGDLRDPRALRALLADAEVPRRTT